MKNLDVQHFRQHVCDDCMYASLKMVMDYHKIVIPYDTIREELHPYNIYGGDQPVTGLCLPQIATYAIRKGLKAEIVTCNPQLFKKTDGNKPHTDLAEIISQFTADKENHKIEKESFLDYLQNDGTLTIDVPSSSHIRQAIDENKPVITILSHYMFYEEAKRKANMHGCVIKGYADNQFYIYDPSEKTPSGEMVLDENWLGYAINSITLGALDNGAILILSPQ